MLFHSLGCGSCAWFFSLLHLHWYQRVLLLGSLGNDRQFGQHYVALLVWRPWDEENHLNFVQQLENPLWLPMFP